MTMLQNASSPSVYANVAAQQMAVYLVIFATDCQSDMQATEKLHLQKKGLDDQICGVFPI